MNFRYLIKKALETHKSMCENEPSLMLALQQSVLLDFVANAVTSGIPKAEVQLDGK